VTFIDACGLGALVRLRNAGREAGKTVELTGVPVLVARLLRITGLDTAFVALLPGVRPKDTPVNKSVI
jgi:anti-sigma B factor antagonist